MCQLCVDRGEMTPEELKAANDSDSDHADYAGLSSILTEGLLASLGIDTLTTAERLKRSLDSVIAGTMAIYDETAPFGGEDPDSADGQLARAAWAGPRLVSEVSAHALGLSNVLLVLEVQRQRARIAELEASRGRMTKDSLELQAKLEAMEAERYLAVKQRDEARTALQHAQDRPWQTD